MDPDVDPRDLDPAVRAELRSLSKETAERVARHLVSAGTLVDDDPEQALAHARAARALAGRVGSVREAVGVAAYRAGEFGEALAELRAARRISGRDDHLPVMADCERALGRPDRALALIASPAALRLDRAARVELRIVESGVRRDLGQHDAAVLALQGPDLDSTRVESWTPRLWYAYAAALADAGRPDEALRWFTAVSAVDDGETDADERVAELEAELAPEGEPADGDDAEPLADAAFRSDEAAEEPVDAPEEPVGGSAGSPAGGRADEVGDTETVAPADAETTVDTNTTVDAETTVDANTTVDTTGDPEPAPAAAPEDGPDAGPRPAAPAPLLFSDAGTDGASGDGTTSGGSESTGS